MTWAGMRIYSDPHTGPYKIHPLFSNKKALKTEVFKAFCFVTTKRMRAPRACGETFSGPAAFFLRFRDKEKVICLRMVC